nr:hypothetical protein [Candidatus Sigynarchaeota archaeon]
MERQRWHLLLMIVIHVIICLGIRDHLLVSGLDGLSRFFHDATKNKNAHRRSCHITGRDPGDLAFVVKTGMAREKIYVVEVPPNSNDRTSKCYHNEGTS